MIKNTPLQFGTLARNASMALYPNLHRGLRMALAPKLGRTDTRLHSLAGYERNVYSDITSTPSIRWIFSDRGWTPDMGASGEAIVYQFPQTGFKIMTMAFRCAPSTAVGPNKLAFWGDVAEGFKIYYRTSPKKFSFETWQASTNVELVNDTVVEDSEWCSVVAIYDHGAMRLHVNGGIAATGSNGSAIGTTTGPFWIGDGWSKYWSTCYVWDRALNRSEVELIHQDPLATLRPREISVGLPVAVGVGNPKGVFGLPLHGSLKGPI